MEQARRTAWLHHAQEQLRSQANPESAARARRFFKENPPILGTPAGLSVTIGQELARAVAAQGTLADVTWLAGQLYHSGIMEEGACASALLEKFHKRFSLADWPLFDNWVAEFTCWGTTDSFCLKVSGHVVWREGPPVVWLRRWAVDALIWRRRAALVNLVRNVRAARDLDLAFSLCDTLLADPEDLVQKAVGWLLKEACKGDVASVENYLATHRAQMQRGTVRYAREGLQNRPPA